MAIEDNSASGGAGRRVQGVDVDDEGKRHEEPLHYAGTPDHARVSLYLNNAPRALWMDKDTPRHELPRFEEQKSRDEPPDGAGPCRAAFLLLNLRSGNNPQRRRVIGQESPTLSDCSPSSLMRDAYAPEPMSEDEEEIGEPWIMSEWGAKIAATKARQFGASCIARSGAQLGHSPERNPARGNLDSHDKHGKFCASRNRGGDQGLGAVSAGRTEVSSVAGSGSFSTNRPGPQSVLGLFDDEDTVTSGALKSGYDNVLVDGSIHRTLALVPNGYDRPAFAANRAFDDFERERNRVRPTSTSDTLGKKCAITGESAPCPSTNAARSRPFSSLDIMDDDSDSSTAEPLGDWRMPFLARTSNVNSVTGTTELSKKDAFTGKSEASPGRIVGPKIETDCKNTPNVDETSQCSQEDGDGCCCNPDGAGCGDFSAGMSRYYDPDKVGFLMGSTVNDYGEPAFPGNTYILRLDGAAPRVDRPYVMQKAAILPSQKHLPRLDLSDPASNGQGSMSPLPFNGFNRIDNSGILGAQDPNYLERQRTMTCDPLDTRLQQQMNPSMRSPESPRGFCGRGYHGQGSNIYYNNSHYPEDPFNGSNSEESFNGYDVERTHVSRYGSHGTFRANGYDSRDSPSGDVASHAACSQSDGDVMRGYDSGDGQNGGEWDGRQEYLDDRRYHEDLLYEGRSSMGRKAVAVNSTLHRLNGAVNESTVDINARASAGAYWLNEANHGASTVGARGFVGRRAEPHTSAQALRVTYARGGLLSSAWGTAENPNENEESKAEVGCDARPAYESRPSVLAGVTEPPEQRNAFGAIGKTPNNFVFLENAKNVKVNKGGVDEPHDQGSAVTQNTVLGVGYRTAGNPIGRSAPPEFVLNGGVPTSGMKRNGGIETSRRSYAVWGGISSGGGRDGGRPAMGSGHNGNFSASSFGRAVGAPSTRSRNGAKAGGFPKAILKPAATMSRTTKETPTTSTSDGARTEIADLLKVMVDATVTTAATTPTPSQDLSSAFATTTSAGNVYDISGSDDVYQPENPPNVLITRMRERPANSGHSFLEGLGIAYATLGNMPSAAPRAASISAVTVSRNADHMIAAMAPGEARAVLNANRSRVPRSAVIANMAREGMVVSSAGRETGQPRRFSLTRAQFAMLQDYMIQASLSAILFTSRATPTSAIGATPTCSLMVVYAGDGHAVGSPPSITSASSDAISIGYRALLPPITGFSDANNFAVAASAGPFDINVSRRLQAAITHAIANNAFTGRAPVLPRGSGDAGLVSASAANLRDGDAALNTRVDGTPLKRRVSSSIPSSRSVAATGGTGGRVRGSSSWFGRIRSTCHAATVAVVSGLQGGHGRSPVYTRSSGILSYYFEEDLLMPRVGTRGSKGARHRGYLVPY